MPEHIPFRTLRQGKGGGKATTSKEVIVATSDPLKGNLVKGGSFVTAEDQANWKIVAYGAGGNWTYSAKGATVSGGHAGIYQAIDVVKDKEYTIDMLVSSASGSDESWFEVYAGKTLPADGVEYKDNKVMGLSTWDGCAKSAFLGRLSTVGCVKNDVTKAVSNVVKFDITGKIYLVIRSGGKTFTKDGITMGRVEFRGK